ncbi:IclR family transcriptional regulator [Anoxybacter fermentans]|uniref:IclR family transcriptional regulator n=1 Tax=Anoxybacter fermentans TaxID=1323375 RepID=UPI000F8ECBA2|nr:IclR family transcriptional regulator [Anoxybacter fermentans]
MSYRRKPVQLVQSLDRALDILEKIVEAEDGLGVTELSKSLELHKSTIYRLLATLAYRGYVRQDPKNEKYKVGIKLFELGNLALNKLELRREVRPFLEELMSRTGETIHLGILDNDEVVYIDKVESPQTIRMYSKIGKRAPVHCTGLGKVLLAYSSSEVIDKVIEKGLRAYTENTITDVDAFKKHLEEIRRQGFAIDNVEHEEGIRCVAGPIFDYSGNVIASFSISGPTMRVTEEKIPDFAQLVRDYSKKMSRALGFIE